MLITRILRDVKIVIYSIYFNFRVLPFRDAIHLPFKCYVWPTILSNKGETIIDSTERKRFMIRLGIQRTPILKPDTFLWNNNGTVVFKGICQIGHHSLIRVTKGGYLEIGDQVGLNTGCRIFCQKKIVLKNKVRASWDCQFYDTNFHPLIDMVTNQPIKMQSPIIIEKNVWIGHNVIISKGVKLGEGIIVSSGSVVKSIFKTPNCIISGNPAVKVGENYKADFDDFQ